MVFPRHLICFSASAWIALFPSANGGRAAELNPEVREAVAWVETLGFPDVKGRPFVLVSTGGWTQVGNQPKRGDVLYGFLFKDQGGRFDVLIDELRVGEESFGNKDNFPLDVRTFTKKPSKADSWPVDYKILDLKKEAMAELEKLRLPRELRHPEEYFGHRLSERADLFLFARACRANDLADLADDLATQAAALPDTHGDGRPHSLRTTLEEDFGDMKMWKAAVDFGDLQFSRRDLLSRFEEIVRLYPACQRAAQARETCEMLRQMIAEDAAHHPKPLAQMTPEEQAAEWIFQLRDQNGHQYSQPGSCDIFDEMRLGRDAKASPAHRLFALGATAVPALIEAMGDTRFTRSVGYWRNFTFSHRVLSVGDCARAILNRMAGRDLFDSRVTSRPPPPDVELAAAQKAAREWWSEYRVKGEKGMWIAGTLRGDHESPELAKHLVEKYPDAALPAIIEGARSSKESWTRMQLVQLAGEMKGDGPVDFLTDEMKNGLSLQTRLAAAKGLDQRQLPEAVLAMIGEWERVRKIILVKGLKDQDGVKSLIGFLARCGQDAAVEALGRQFGEEPPDARISIMEALGRDPLHRNESGSVSSFFRWLIGTADPISESGLIAERLLTAALADREAAVGAAVYWDNNHVADPRVCDTAALMLSRRWPAKYAFQWSASSTECDEQIRKMRNAVRAERGEAPLPEPVIPPVAR